MKSFVLRVCFGQCVYRARQVPKIATDLITAVSGIVTLFGVSSCRRARSSVVGWDCLACASSATYDRREKILRKDEQGTTIDARIKDY
eukprot:SAG31_NODE_5_length_43735_cov_42.922266_39_plen_88_part_00